MEGWRGRREGARGRVDGGHTHVPKVQGRVRKANQGDTFANDLGKLSPSAQPPDTSRKVRTLGVRVLSVMTFVLVSFRHCDDSHSG